MQILQYFALALNLQGILSEVATGGVLKRGVLKKFAKFAGKHQGRSFFFNNVAIVRPVIYLKGYFDAVVFKRIVRNFKNTFF